MPIPYAMFLVVSEDSMKFLYLYIDFSCSVLICLNLLFTVYIENLLSFLGYNVFTFLRVLLITCSGYLHSFKNCLNSSE